MKAREIMTKNPEVVTSEDTVTRAAQMMRDTNVGIMPVVADRSSMTLQGVITDRDIAVRHVAEGHDRECTVGDHMTRERIDTADPDDDVDDLMKLMQRDQVRRIPIVEDGNRLVGIVAQADLAVRAGRKEPKEVEQTVEKISEPARPER